MVGSCVFLLRGRYLSFVRLFLHGGVLPKLHPPSLEELDGFRNKLLDPAVYTWVQIGSDQWFRLVEIGPIYRNSVKGAAYEARLEPGTPAGAMGYFHMCRLGPCTFTGGSESQLPVKGCLLCT